MLKKLILAIIVVAIGTVFYTETTGKTDFSSMIYTYLLGEEPPSKTEENHYTLIKKEKPLSAAEQAKKDASEYHQEAKKFASGANKTVNDINEKAK